MKTFVTLLVVGVLCAIIASAASVRSAEKDDDVFFSAKRRVSFNEEPEHPEHPENPEEIVEHSFEVPINHFSAGVSRTFNFTYRMNHQFYRRGGPIFIHIHNSGDHSNRWIESGLMVDLSRELGAALVVGDHRYSGVNIPTPTVSVAHLQPLNVENILADIAHLITDARSRFEDPSARVILWGSDLGAKFAVWARQKYPHLVHAVWSSSGRFQAEPVTQSFYNQLSWTIRTVDEDGQCQERVQALFAEMVRAIAAGECAQKLGGLNMCGHIPAGAHRDVSLLIEGIIYNIAEYLDSNHLLGLQSFCQDMNRYPEDVVRSFVRWRDYVWGDFLPHCWNFNYEQVTGFLRNETLEAATTRVGTRQYYYMRCAQLGYLKTTSENGLFPDVVPEEFHFQMCSDIFGEEFNAERLQRATNALHIEYGSRNQVATNVVYTNGALDSWLDHGITDDTIPGSHVILLPFAGKSADLTSIEDWQPAEIIAAKRRIMELIREWTHQA